MDKEKVIQELQERTEEIKEKAGELHKAIEETISQKKQIHYTELGGQDGQPDVPVKEGYGLVLGGGGGRGSYEIGVWKALEEYRDVIDIKAVSGSSVGALNAALYACGDLDKATQMWYDITNDRILSNKDIDEDNRNKWFESIKEKLTTIDSHTECNRVHRTGCCGKRHEDKGWLLLQRRTYGHTGEFTST